PPVTPLNSNFPLLLVVVLRVGAPEHESSTVTPTAGVPVTPSAVPTRNPRACASQLRSGPGSPSATLTPGPLLIVPRTVCPWALPPAVEPVLFELEPQPATTTSATTATAHAPILDCHPRLSMRSPSACVGASQDHPSSRPGRRRATRVPVARATRNVS